MTPNDTGFVTEQAGGYYKKDIITERIHPFSLSGGAPPHTHLLGSKCPPPEERRLSMPEIGEKERNYLKVTQT